MKIVITSYKRVDVLKKKTYKMLKKYNIDDKDIYLFVAPSEMDEYKQAFPNVNIIKSSAGPTPLDFLKSKKQVLTHFPNGTKFLQLDDDITAIVKLHSPVVKPIQSLKKFYDMGFKVLEKTELKLAGIYPTPNGLWMSKSQPITTDLRFLYGAVRFYIVDTKLLPSIGGKEDYEMSILYYKKYGGVVRLNHYSVKADYMGGVGGRNRSQDKKDSDAFIKKYDDYISRVITHSSGTTSFLLKKNQ